MLARSRAGSHGQARKSKLALAYHNHDFEFIDQNGRRGYDIILNETDPALVKQLTLELYLSPRRTPTLDGGLPLGRLVRRWVFRGALGKDTRRAAGKALDAAERLDVATLEARWRSRP